MKSTFRLRRFLASRFPALRDAPSVGLVAVSVWLSALSAQATDIQWSGATSTAWNVGGNWVGGVVPTAVSDNAVFTGTFTNQPNIPVTVNFGALWLTGTLGQNVTISSSGNFNFNLRPSTATSQIGGVTGLGLLIDNTDSRTLSISANTQLQGGAQEWRNASGNLFTLSGNLTLNGQALTLSNTGAGATAISGFVSGGSVITINNAGTGTTTFSGNNSYTGATKISSGVLSVGTIGYGGVTGNLGAATNAATNLLLDGGTLRYTGATATTDRNFTLTATKTSTIDVTTNNLTMAGASTSTSGALTKIGAGTLTLFGANLYTGATNISNGSLVARSASALGTGAAANVSVALGANLAYAAVTNAALAIGGTLTIAGGAGTSIGTSIGSTTTGAQINVTGAATISDAAYKINIFGVSGVTHANGLVTLIHGGAGSSLDPASAFTLGSVYNNTDFTVGGFTRTATDLQVTTTAAAALTTAFWTGGLTGNTNVWAASDGSTTSNWTPTAGGSAQPLVPGSGADVTISATTPNTAPTGTVLGADMSIKSLTIADTNNGLGLNADGYKLTVGSGGIVLNASVPASTIGSDIGLAANQTWNIGSGGLSVGGAVSGAFSLAKTGAGTLALSGFNTFSGGLTISSGTVSVNSNTTLGGTGGTTGAISIDGGTLRTTNTASINYTHPVTVGNLNGGATINVAGNGTVGGGGQVTFNTTNLLLGAGPLTVTGNGSLDSTGSGVLALTSTNTYSGSITIRDGGLVQYGNIGSTAAASTFTLGNNGSLSTSVALSRTVLVSGTGTLLGFNNGAGGSYTSTITLNNNVTVSLKDWYGATGRNGAISGQITGTGGLNVNTATNPANNSLTLSNTTSDYTGNTVINNAILNSSSVANLGTASSIGKGNTGAASEIVLNNLGNFRYVGAVAASTDRLFSVGAGSAIIDASGQAVSFTNPGAVGFGGQTGARTLTLTGNAFTSTLASVIGDNGGATSISKIGNVGNVWVLSGANTYTGTTTITNGTLAIGTNGSIANSSQILVGASTTLDVTAAPGFTVGTSQTISGMGSVKGSTLINGTLSPGASPGTLAFANDLGLGSTAMLAIELNPINMTLGGGVNDLFTVAGNFVLDGTINFTGTSSFAGVTSGAWTFGTYVGGLTDNGLILGSQPALDPGYSWTLDTSNPGQLNLVIVPEPGSALLTALASAGFLVRRRRK